MMFLTTAKPFEARPQTLPESGKTNPDRASNVVNPTFAFI
jgi:hypothetical protein